MIIGNNKLLWKDTISLIDSEAAFWNPNCQSVGWFAKATVVIKKLVNINKVFFILNSYIKLFFKNYTLVFATIYQLIA